MQILKLYMKVVKTKARIICMYFGIFLVFFSMFASFIKGYNPSTEFQAVKPSISILDHDQSVMSKNFQKFLAGKATITDIGTDETDLKDALFYGQISYMIEIPKGFETAFLQGEKDLIICESRPNDSQASMLQMNIESYMKNMRIYHETTSLSTDQLHEKVMSTMKDQIKVEMRADEQVSLESTFLNSFYNYFAYIITALILLVVGTAMITIFRTDVHKRTLLSPLSTSSMNLQLLSANMLIATIFWVCFSLISMAYTSEVLFTLKGLAFLINSYLITLVSVAIAYLVSCVLSNKAHFQNALDGITNLYALASAFLCGAFVPQMFISQSILNFSQLLPTYWYVKANDTLGTASELTGADWTSILQCFGIEILFGIVFLLLALVVMKNRRSQESYLMPGEQLE